MDNLFDDGATKEENFEIVFEAMVDSLPWKKLIEADLHSEENKEEILCKILGNSFYQSLLDNRNLTDLAVAFEAVQSKGNDAVDEYINSCKKYTESENDNPAKYLDFSKF